MRKYTIVAAFFALLFSLSVTAAYACQPGCDCDNVLPMMQNRADAKRLETKAHARQVIKQNDNSVGMTCFDRALMLTAKLGGIFSDVAPGLSLPVANESVFGTSSFPDYGASNKLVRGLDAVVTPTMQGHVMNFTDSLSHALGATVAGYLNAFVGSVINDFLSNISGPLGDLGGYVSQVNTYYNTLVNAMSLLGVSMPTVVMGAVATINGMWAAINAMISGVVAAVTNAINGLVNAVVGMIQSAMHGLMAAMTPEGECSRIAKLWGNGNMPDLTMFPDWRSLMGGAVERGTPYFTMFEMLSGAIPSSFGTPGTHLMQELMNSSNSSIITNAMNDLSGGLSGPNTGLPSWQTQPIIPVSSSLDAIIGQM
ncbi:MAG: hypothetical protein RBS08_04935 [Bdellovibrionales bacterium]|jgi:hypothetical protein|nr:hypothetical protein [Bdellovibrionales bacterium]